MCGSLRKGSYSKMLLQNTVRLAPDDISIEIYDGMRDLPYYDQDFELDPPAIVRDFKRRVHAADALLFVTPEFNHSIPGVLKNAVDWLSRPSKENNFAGKPVAVCGEAAGDPATIPLLVGLGVDELSVGPARLPDVLGRRAARALKRGEPFALDMII